MSLVVAEKVSKEYRVGEVPVRALKDVSFAIEPASFVSFVGPSGSGKTTLLNLIGCLDKPMGGDLRVNGVEVLTLDRRASASFRGNHLGFIFQDFNLLPVLTVYENIEYPLLMVQNAPPGEREKRVLALLEAVGMSDQKDKYPDQISGGQKQRVAVARVLVTQDALFQGGQGFRGGNRAALGDRNGQPPVQRVQIDHDLRQGAEEDLQRRSLHPDLHAQP